MRSQITKMYYKNFGYRILFVKDTVVQNLRISNKV